MVVLLPERNQVVMDSDKKTAIRAFLRNQIALAPARLESMRRDRQTKELLPRRSAWLKLDQYIRGFVSGSTDFRWIALTGLRGTGKTTLLAQLYASAPGSNDRKLYLSLDEGVDSLGASLNEILQVYEELLGSSFENLTEPVFLFLDEVQYESGWGLALKAVHNRTKNIFIISTGSSALSLQNNADIARRVVFSRLWPMSFCEYVLLKHGRKPIGIGRKISAAAFLSDSAQSAFDSLKAYESTVNKYWSSFDRFEIGKYLKYGTLPFTINLPSEALAYSLINQSLNEVLKKDVPQLNAFRPDTLSKLNPILYAVSNSNETSLTSLSNSLEIDYQTLEKVFEAFEKTEVLIRIYPFGSHLKQTRKPSKYHFTSPAYRASFYNLVGSTFPENEYKGKLFEDAVTFYLNRIFIQEGGYALTYDPVKGGVDFIMTNKGDGTNIPIEVGMGKKRSNQVRGAMARIPSKYGVTVSGAELSLDTETNCLQLPIRYFLVM